MTTTSTSPARTRNAGYVDRWKPQRAPVSDYQRERGRDVREPGVCIYPGCGIECDGGRYGCVDHWRRTPNPWRDVLRETGREDPERWLLAVESLRCFWLATAG